MALNRDLGNVLNISAIFAAVQPTALIHLLALVDHLWGGALEIFRVMTHPKFPFENLQGISHSFALGVFERLQL